jgi:PPM family protein phosphatase
MSESSTPIEALVVAAAEDEVSRDHAAPAPSFSCDGSVRAAGHTRQGSQRYKNEDSYAIALDLGLFLVADGIGGHNCGEIASTMAIELVRQTFEHPFSAELRQPASLPLLVHAIEGANRAIYRVARGNPALRGMGTTLAAVHVHPGGLSIAHVGDSRIYRFRGGRLERLTQDHSYRNECLRMGGELEGLPVAEHGHKLARSIGTRFAVEVEARLEEARAGDVLLLCSDGLSGVMQDAEIAAALVEHHDLDTAARTLLDRAEENGAHDDLTCVLVRWMPRGSDGLDRSGQAAMAGTLGDEAAQPLVHPSGRARASPAPSGARAALPCRRRPRQRQPDHRRDDVPRDLEDGAARPCDQPRQGARRDRRVDPTHRRGPMSGLFDMRPFIDASCGAGAPAAGADRDDDGAGHGPAPRVVNETAPSGSVPSPC